MVNATNATAETWEYALFYANVELVFVVAVVLFVVHTCRTRGCVCECVCNASNASNANKRLGIVL